MTRGRRRCLTDHAPQAQTGPLWIDGNVTLSGVQDKPFRGALS